MNDMSNLPTWDLTDLFAGPDDPEIETQLQVLEKSADAFQNKYQGQVAGLSGDDLHGALQDYEAAQDRLGRLMAFAFLHYAGDMADPERGRFMQVMQERVNGITGKSLFFSIEINRLDEESMAVKYDGSAELRRYRPWLDDIRAMRPYMLSDDAEQLLHDKSVTGAAAWIRLFDDTMARLKFDLDGEQLPSQVAFDRLTSADETVRKKAADAINETLSTNIHTFALITNTLAKDRDIENSWRKLETPEQSRHILNQVEPEVVGALKDAVVGNYAQLSHRYYALKARWMGKDVLEHWDRNAPLPDTGGRRYSWSDAETMVLDAYQRFSPQLADIGRQFFQNAWIDAGPRAGKSPGAFAHPTVPSAHPYLLLNFQGRVRDVMTLAHELGHGVHQVLAGDQGALLCNTPLTLAETASVFGEMLTFRSLLSGVENPAQRRTMIAGKVEDMLNTVVRQTAFYEFELRLHRARQQGELTSDAIGDIWMAVQSESLGPAIRLGDDYRSYWSYIPHFIHSPFYVYAYAFGDCLVNALYNVYEQAPDGFQEKYLDLLRAGGTKRHRELLAPFGLDASDPAFWNRGLNVISGFIDELEQLEGQ